MSHLDPGHMAICRKDPRIHSKTPEGGHSADRYFRILATWLTRIPYLGPPTIFHSLKIYCVMGYVWQGTQMAEDNNEHFIYGHMWIWTI